MALLLEQAAAFAKNLVKLLQQSSTVAGRDHEVSGDYYPQLATFDNPVIAINSYVHVLDIYNFGYFVAYLFLSATKAHYSTE